MKMNCKGFIGLLGIFLAFGLVLFATVLTGCPTDTKDNTVTSTEYKLSDGSTLVVKSDGTAVLTKTDGTEISGTFSNGTVTLDGGKGGLTVSQDGSVSGTVDNTPVGGATPTSIEAAFANMLKANFISGSDVTVSPITKMSNWGQTNSEYAVTGKKGSIEYRLPSSFGTVQVISGGAVLMTGPDASIVWGTAEGATTYISGSSSRFSFEIPSGSDAKTVSYPYTVSYPSGSNARIEGKLNLNLSKW
jgi:hypothetical protein